MSADVLTPDEMAAMEKDLAASKNALAEKERAETAARAKDEGRKEAEREASLKSQIEEQQRKAAELEKRLSESAKQSKDELDALKTKMDEMASSKAVLQTQNPFKPPIEKDIDSWSQEQVDKVEQASARAFFGPDYDRMLEQTR